MLKTHFERLVDDEMGKTLLSLLTPLGDPIAHARLVGRYQGLQQALELSRAASSKDVEDHF